MASSFFTGQHISIAAAGSTQGGPILSGGDGHFSAAGPDCRTDAGSKPSANAATAAGECAVTGAAPTDSLESAFFHMSFTVTAKKPDQAAADWTNRVVDSVSKYVDVNCEEGILVRSYHATTLRIEAVFNFPQNGSGHMSDVI